VSNKLVPPACGLQQLTWRQVEMLDAKIRSLCVYTQQMTDVEIILPIMIRNGKPVKIGEPIRLEKFSPTAL
jgi:hypothetical protein